MNQEFIVSLRAELDAMVRNALANSPYGFIIAVDPEPIHLETAAKHVWERNMLRDRQTIRGKQAIVLSSECVDRNCGGCMDPDCCCECHVQDGEPDGDEDVAD